jgi:hypothetical protein
MMDEKLVNKMTPLRFRRRPDFGKVSSTPCRIFPTNLCLTSWIEKNSSEIGIPKELNNCPGGCAQAWTRRIVYDG